MLIHIYNLKFLVININSCNLKESFLNWHNVFFFVHVIKTAKKENWRNVIPNVVMFRHPGNKCGFNHYKCKIIFLHKLRLKQRIFTSTWFASIKSHNSSFPFYTCVFVCFRSLEHYLTGETHSVTLWYIIASYCVKAAIYILICLAVPWTELNTFEN